MLTGAQLGYVSEGSNAAGAALAGVLPHRDAGGQPVATVGLNARAMLETPLKAYLMLGGIEPAQDLGAPNAARRLEAAECVVMLTPYVTEAMRRFAHVLLPIGTFAETSGTFVNLEGRWQSFLGAAHPVGESRPAWKVLRVLGNLFDLPGFEYDSSEAVRDELKGKLGQIRPDNAFAPRRVLNGERPAGTAADVPMYQVDALVRRAPALQKTRESQLTTPR
jgi:NADH-quinone oxidoreductase subunit G